MLSVTFLLFSQQFRSNNTAFRSHVYLLIYIYLLYSHYYYYYKSTDLSDTLQNNIIIYLLPNFFDENVLSFPFSDTYCVTYLFLQGSTEGQMTSWQWTVEHVIFPAVRASVVPPKRFADDATILEIANMPDLYRVFERC